jgi:DNA-binding response OmpR family regulator
LAGERFDAIVCDLMMPEMSGMDFFAELEAFAPEQTAQIILLTGGAFTPRASEFLDHISNPRLFKPFSGNELRELVRAVVEEKPTAP